MFENYEYITKHIKAVEQHKQESQRKRVEELFNKWKRGKYMADWEKAMLIQSRMFTKEIKEISENFQSEASNESLL